MDLNKIVNDKMTELKESGYVEERVAHHLKKTVDDIVEDCLRSYSDFGKKLKEEVKKQLDFNLERLDIPSYNQVILNVISDELDKATHQQGAEAIREGIKELLGTAEKQYKLSDLVYKMANEDDKLNELDYDEYKEITVIVEKKYSSQYIYMDPEEDTDWYQCKYQIVLDDDNTVRRVEIGGKHFDNKVIMGGLYGLDKVLFQMWTRHSELIVDSYDTSFTNPEHD